MTSSNENIFCVTGHLCETSPVPVNSPHNGQWREALMFSLICAWINGWVKKSRGWWFETQSRLLWRQRNVFYLCDDFEASCDQASLFALWGNCSSALVSYNIGFQFIVSASTCFVMELHDYERYNKNNACASNIPWPLYLWHQTILEIKTHLVIPFMLFCHILLFFMAYSADICYLKTKHEIICCIKILPLQGMEYSHYDVETWTRFLHCSFQRGTTSYLLWNVPVIWDAITVIWRYCNGLTKSDTKQMVLIDFELPIC